MYIGNAVQCEMKPTAVGANPGRACAGDLDEIEIRLKYNLSVVLK